MNSSPYLDKIDDPSNLRKLDEKDLPPRHPMRRASMEEFFVEENNSEQVKHAILEKKGLKRWDSGEFYSSPEGYRQMLATQAKEVLRQALEKGEEDHRPRRSRRSSLSHEMTEMMEEEM